MSASSLPLPHAAPEIKIPGAGTLAEFSGGRTVVLLFLRHLG